MPNERHASSRETSERIDTEVTTSCRQNWDADAALEPLIGSATLVVVSTDFTHYGPRFSFVPFTTDVPGRLKELDMGAVDCILDLDHEP